MIWLLFTLYYRKDTGHILIGTEMKLHFMNVPLGIVAVIDLEMLPVM